MKKTIDLTDKEIEIVKNYQKDNHIRSFSMVIKDIISKINNSNDQFIELKDAISKLNEKLETLSIHIAPRNVDKHTPPKSRYLNG